VQLIEAGTLAAPETRRLLQRVIEPMLRAGVDTLVLGCTHYPFIRPLLTEIAGEKVAIIDPAPAVARHTGNVLQNLDLVAPAQGEGSLRCFSSGEARQLDSLMALLLGYSCATEQVHWQGDELLAG
jgi:glutamate racemase